MQSLTEFDTAIGMNTVGTCSDGLKAPGVHFRMLANYHWVPSLMIDWNLRTTVLAHIKQGKTKARGVSGTCQASLILDSFIVQH